MPDPSQVHMSPPQIVFYLIDRVGEVAALTALPKAEQLDINTPNIVVRASGENADTDSISPYTRGIRTHPIRISVSWWHGRKTKENSCHKGEHQLFSG